MRGLYNDAFEALSSRGVADVDLIGVDIVYYELVLISLNPEYQPRIHMENIKELADVLPCLIFCLTLCFDRTEQEPGIALTIILTRM